MCVTRMATHVAPFPASSSRSSAALPPGIDDDGLACRAVRAHGVAVRPDRAELVAVDGERHYLAEEPRAFSALFCAMRNISESMKKLNGMKNTMSSATLRITDPGVEPSGLSR